MSRRSGSGSQSRLLVVVAVIALPQFILANALETLQRSPDGTAKKHSMRELLLDVDGVFENHAPHEWQKQEQKQKKKAIATLATRLRSPLSSGSATVAVKSAPTDCPPAQLVLPVLASIVSMGIVLLMLRRHVHSSSANKAARTVILFPQFVLLVGSSIVVLDSFRISQIVGMSDGGSGLLVGINWLGAGIGFASMWLALRRYPTIWYQRPKEICYFGLGMNITGVILYLVGVHTIGNGSADSLAKTERSFNYVEPLLMVARALGGVGQGLIAQLLVVLVQTLTSNAEMTEQMTRVFFVNMIGVGFGPLVVAIAYILRLCPMESSGLVLAPLLQLIFCSSALLGVVLFFPDLSDEAEARGHKAASEVVASTEQGPQLPYFRRRFLIACCCAMFIIRCFVCSGVEVGSVLMLERDFRFDGRVAGLVVGITFLSAIPVRYLHQWLIGYLSVVGQYRFFATCSLVGTLLLSKTATKLLPSGVSILVADAIIFPCTALGDGLCYGQLMMNVLPAGSILDKNNVAFACNVLGMAAGRFGGQWLTRWYLEALGPRGQDQYSLGQMIACGMAFVLFEVGVRPGVKTG